MTSEQRLDRLERIAMLMTRAGSRVRREQNDKINIIIDAQIRNEDRFARNEERFSVLARSHEELAQSVVGLRTELARSHVELAALIARSHDELAQRHNELAQSLSLLAEAQTRTESRLDSLIDTINRDRNGNSG